MDDTCGRKSFSNYVRLYGKIFVEDETYVRNVACFVRKIEATFMTLLLGRTNLSICLGNMCEMGQLKRINNHSTRKKVSRRTPKGSV